MVDYPSLDFGSGHDLSQGRGIEPCVRLSAWWGACFFLSLCNSPSTVKDKQPQGRAMDEEQKGPKEETIPSHPPPSEPCSKIWFRFVAASHCLDSTRKHYILALLFHLPLVQSALAPCQINIPIPWKPDEISSGGVDLSSWPQLPGSLQSQWQPPPLPQCWGPEV